MDQVRLEWGVEHAALLARIRIKIIDGEECWLCSSEVRGKLASGVQRQAWNHAIRGERHCS